MTDERADIPNLAVITERLSQLRRDSDGHDRRIERVEIAMTQVVVMASQVADIQKQIIDIKTGINDLADRQQSREQFTQSFRAQAEGLQESRSQNARGAIQWVIGLGVGIILMLVGVLITVLLKSIGGK